MKLLELFDKPSFWTLTQDDPERKAAKFITTGGASYTMSILIGAEGPTDQVWDLGFAKYETGKKPSDGVTTGISGTGETFEVFSTVLDFTAHFIEQDPPSKIEFIGSEPSRQKLYLALCKKLAAKYGYTFIQEHGELFTLVKK